MATTLGEMKRLLLQEMTLNPNDIHTEMARLAISDAYIYVCSGRKWDFLKREKTYTPTTYPIVLPANLTVVESVMDNVGNRYVNDESGGRVNPLYNYNWYFDSCITTSLVSGSNATVENDSTDVTSAAEFTVATCVGEYIQIGDISGMYEIETYTSTSAIVIANPFRGKATGARFVIRPEGTKTMNFCDHATNDLEPEEVTVVYYIEPLPLYNDWDPILTPGNSSAIRLQAMQIALKRLGKVRDARLLQDDIRIATGAMIRTTHRNVESFKPRGYFKRRSSSYTELADKYRS